MNPQDNKKDYRTFISIHAASEQIRCPLIAHSYMKISPLDAHWDTDRQQIQILVQGLIAMAMIEDT